MPLISVVVPTFNQGHYLAACLDSLMFQSYPNLEIIVVADQGHDDTFAVLGAYAHALQHDTVTWVSGCDVERLKPVRTTSARYPQQGRTLTIVRNEKSSGSTGAYNLGMYLASGEYCTYVSSDDLCYPQMFTTLAPLLDNGTADFAYADMFIIDDAGCILRQFNLPDYSFARSFADWYLCGVAKLYRRSLHETYGYFNPEFAADDHECYLRFAMNGARFVHVPQVLYAVRSHAQRAVDVHTPARMERLLYESCQLAKDARTFLTASPQTSNAEKI